LYREESNVTDEQKAAYIMAQSVSALVEALGMISTNLDRLQNGMTIAYDDAAFLQLQKDYVLTHNAVISLFHD